MIPKFSIIIAVYNGVHTLKACLDSVISQSYPNWEVIVIDGGSSDGTAELLKKNDAHIEYWLSEPDNGLYDAWNKALNRINGDWICFLGADDKFYSKNTLEKVAEFINSYKDSYDLLCGSVEMVSKKRKWIIDPELKEFPINMFPHQGVFHSIKLFENGNKFSTDFKIRGDYEFIVRANSHKRLKLAAINDLTVASCVAGGLSSAAKVRIKCFLETFRVRKRFKLEPYSLDMHIFMYKAILLNIASILGLKK